MGSGTTGGKGHHRWGGVPQVGNGTTGGKGYHRWKEVPQVGSGTTGGEGHHGWGGVLGVPVVTWYIVDRRIKSNKCRLMLV